MVVRLRLSPHRLCPTSRDKIYHIVAMNAPRARDSAPLETLGIYDPIPRQLPRQPAYEKRSLLDEGKKDSSNSVFWAKRVEWDRERVKYWLAVGAQPTRRLAWLLHKENLIPPGHSYFGYSGPSKPAKKQKPGTQQAGKSSTSETQAAQ